MTDTAEVFRVVADRPAFRRGGYLELVHDRASLKVGWSRQAGWIGACAIECVAVARRLIGPVVVIDDENSRNASGRCGTGDGCRHLYDAADTVQDRMARPLR